MAQQIKDLDALVGPPIKVKLGDVIYKLPVDIPAPLYLKILHFADMGEGAPDAELVEDLYEEMLMLFQTHQPELERLPVSLRQLVDSVGVIYGSDDDGAEDEDEEGAVPPTRTAGTQKRRSSAKKTRPAKSASSTS